MGPTHRGPKSGGDLVTLFGGYSYDGLNAAIGVLHREVPNQSGCKLVTLSVVTLMRV